MKTSANNSGRLKRVLGLPSLIAIAVGVVVAQVVFISILQGVGIVEALFCGANYCIYSDALLCLYFFRTGAHAS